MRLDYALAGVTRLGIDTAPLIYLLERAPTRLPVLQDLAMRITSGRLLAFTSAITLTEVLVMPMRFGDAALERRHRRILLGSRNFFLTVVHVDIAIRAAELRARYVGLRTPDALALATAAETGCQAFITNDRRLSQVKDVQVLILDDLTL